MNTRIIAMALLLAACSGSSTDEATTGHEVIEETLESPEIVDVIEVEEITQLPKGQHGYSNGLLATQTLSEGWSVSETWGTWTLGSMSTLNLIPDNQDADALDVYFSVFPPPADPAYLQTIRVSSNAFDTQTWEFSPDVTPACVHRRIILRAPIGDTPNIEIIFEISNPVSPAAYGQSEDVREIGLGLQRIYESLQTEEPIEAPC